MKESTVLWMKQNDGDLQPLHKNGSPAYILHSQPSNQRLSQTNLGAAYTLLSVASRNFTKCFVLIK